MKSEITSGLACHLISMAVGSSLTAGSFILAFSVMSKGPITAEASYAPEANTKKQGIITEDEELSLSGDEIAPNFSIASDTASTADAQLLKAFLSLKKAIRAQRGQAKQRTRSKSNKKSTTAPMGLALYKHQYPAAAGVFRCRSRPIIGSLKPQALLWR